MRLPWVTKRGFNSKKLVINFESIVADCCLDQLAKQYYFKKLKTFDKVNKKKNRGITVSSSKRLLRIQSWSFSTEIGTFLVYF